MIFADKCTLDGHEFEARGVEVVGVPPAGKAWTCFVLEELGRRGCGCAR